MHINSLLTASAASLACFSQPTSRPGLAFCPPLPATPYQQAAIFNDYVNALYVEKNVSGAHLTHVSENYIQHNPNILSGRQATIDGLSGIWPSINFTVVHSGVSAGFGYIHTKSVLGDTLSAVSDVYRFDGTCIMEHWDVLQAKPENAPNPLAMF